MSKICFNRALEVLGTGMILVPGCEPTSAMSSDTLTRFNECECATVPLDVALEAIPGSTIRFGINNNTGIRLRWFVLPEECPECPCNGQPDYYGILRGLCQEPEPEPELEDCEVNWSINQCLPDMRGMEIERPNPYYPEYTQQPQNNLWASSPWYLQQKSKAEAAGEDPPTLPGGQMPMPPANKESVVLGSGSSVQSSADCIGGPDEGMDDLMDALGMVQ